MMPASMSPAIPAHIYEVRPRKDHRGVELIFDALPFGALWYTKLDELSDTRSFTAGHITM